MNLLSTMKGISGGLLLTEFFETFPEMLKVVIFLVLLPNFPFLSVPLLFDLRRRDSPYGFLALMSLLSDPALFPPFPTPTFFS